MRCLLWVLFSFFPCLVFGDLQNYVRHTDFMGEISNAAIKEMCRLYDLHPSAEGGGGMYVIRGFSVSFQVYRPFTVEEARRMAVDCEEIFLEKINGFRRARPYFIEFPMPAERVGLRFFIEEPNSSNCISKSPISIFRVSEGKERICKITYDLERGAFDPYIHVHEETFEEAQRIVHEERLKAPSLQEKLYKPSYLKNKNNEENPPAAEGFFARIKRLMNLGGKEEKKRGKYECAFLYQQEAIMLDEYCQKIGKEENLNFIWVGDFNDASPKNPKGYSYGFSFFGSQKLELPQAQKLVTKIMRQILEKLHTAPEVKAVMESKWKTKYYWATDPEKGVPLNDITLKIAFWDENNDRIMPPHIAQILLLNEKLQYFTCDPKTQKLVLLFEEPLESSLRSLNP